MYYEKRMKAKPSTFHIGVAPTSRARCRKCKLQVPKGCPRIITTAHVKYKHTVRFTRCVLCIDTKLAAAIISAYGSATRIPFTPDVDPDRVQEIRATITRFAGRPAIMPAPCREAAQP